MLLRNLKISVDYPNTSYIPPKIGQVCCRRIRGFKNCITAEIINENDTFGLYKAPIEVKAYDEKGYYLGRNGSFINASDKIMFLFPKEKYIFTTCLDFPRFKWTPPIATMLFSSKNVAKVKFKFLKLNWKDFTNIYLPQTIIYQDSLHEINGIKKNILKLLKMDINQIPRLSEINGKYILQFTITNLSKKKHSCQLNVGFYNSNGILIGGILGYTYCIKPNMPKQIYLNTHFKIPSDCNYIIQPWVNTLFFNPFRKRKK